MNDVLSALLGSPARVKILRLFLSNLDSCYTSDEVAKRAKVHPQTVRKELDLFTKIGLLKKQNDTRIVTKGRGKNKKEAKKKVSGFIIDSTFADLLALRNFILNINPTDDNGILKKINGTGKIKLVIISGVFIRDTDSRIDILVVGDSLKDSRLKEAIRDLESHMGHELRYAAFSTPDFTYRLSVYDRLIRDVLDYPHQIIVDKMAPAWKDVHMRKIGKVQ
ncbi:hypothetical protein CL644_02430 [bacterium]|nr:hypothetical protein [bacterium]|tara:strand:+ start:13464 stop:14126 length:663 start_codon:yes stop_codon:yes gene_type:complete